MNNIKQKNVIYGMKPSSDLPYKQVEYINHNECCETLNEVDINNLANLLNSEWGCFQQISSETILQYKGGNYTFTEPNWHKYNNFLSTWNVLLHVRYSF